MADGDHPFLERLRAADLPMVLTSSLTLERQDGQGIMNAINKLADGTNLLNAEDHWNGINVLHSESAKINALELGITS
jgi:NADH dehydrogenase (ubiquinone) Fe-S protein 1